MKEDNKIKITKSWIIYFIIANIIVLIGGIYQKSELVSIISSVSGVIYVLLVAKERKIAFVFGAINVLLYGLILLKQNVYGGVIYNIFYSLPMMIYGYFAWGKKSKEKNSGIRNLGKKTKIILILVFTIAIIIYSQILKYMGGNQTILDSITTILGFLGIYLMTNKYMEQWITWIIVNASNVLMWIILVNQNITNLPVLLMWFIYLINSIYGYIEWRKKYKNILN